MRCAGGWRPWRSSTSWADAEPSRVPARRDRNLNARASASPWARSGAGRLSPSRAPGRANIPRPGRPATAVWTWTRRAIPSTWLGGARGGVGLWPVTVRSDHGACAHTAFKPRACGPALDHDGWRRTGRAATGASLRAHCHAAAALKCMSTLSTGWRRQPGGGPSESPGANRPTATLTPGRLRRARPGTAHESGNDPRAREQPTRTAGDSPRFRLSPFGLA